MKNQVAVSFCTCVKLLCRRDSSGFIQPLLFITLSNWIGLTSSAEISGM